MILLKEEIINSLVLNPNKLSIITEFVGQLPRIQVAFNLIVEEGIEQVNRKEVVKEIEEIIRVSSNFEGIANRRFVGKVLGYINSFGSIKGNN